MLICHGKELYLTVATLEATGWVFITVRPLPDDQTLLVKHLNFGYKAKCFAVWPRRETLLVRETFACVNKRCLELFSKYRKTLAKQSNNVCQTFEFSLLSKMFYHLITSKTKMFSVFFFKNIVNKIWFLLAKQCFATWPKVQTLIGKQISIV